MEGITGFEPQTSAIPVQCSANWANKPTGSYQHVGSRLAQLVERCLSSVHYCEDRFHIHFFNKKTK